MLVISRKPTQEIHIGDDIVIRVLRIERERVCIGIKAPQEIEIVRPDAKDQTPRHRKEQRYIGNVADKFREAINEH